jgi:8-oxo-dGTP pyrophosphatase MutT (NUDIX family)
MAGSNPDAADAAAVIRHSVRALVIDHAQRVLLFVSTDDGGQPFWYSPGGGSEPGETAEETVRRELREEAGLIDVELDPELWRRRGRASWGGVTYDYRERWFLARVAAFEVNTSRFTELERRSIVGYRWWTVVGLGTTTDRLVPDNLEELVHCLLRDGPPEHPIDLGD